MPARPFSAAVIFLALFGAGAQAETLSVSGGAGALRTALQDAQDGDVLEIKGGLYRTSDLGDEAGLVLSRRANITLRAKGKVTIDGEGSFADFGLTVTDVAGLTIEGITFRNHSNDGIFMTGSSDFVARRCKFIDCGDSGIEDRSTAGYTVEDCVFIRCSWGLACGYDSSGASGVTIRGCKFTTCSDYGIDLWSSDALVEDNKFKSGEEAYGVGIREGFTGSTVQDNRFSKGFNGIYAAGSGHQLLRNSVKKTLDDGIQLLDGGGHTCSANRVQKSAGSALYIDSADNTVSENVLKKSGEFDLESTLPLDANTFTDNVFGSSSFGG